MRSIIFTVEKGMKVGDLVYRSAERAVRKAVDREPTGVVVEVGGTDYDGIIQGLMVVWFKDMPDGSLLVWAETAT